MRTIKLDKMLEELRPSDVVYCYTPAVFGIGVENCINVIQSMLDRGVYVRSCLFGDVTKDLLNHIRISGEIVRECFEIECDRLNKSARGAVATRGGFFWNGTWQVGRGGRIKAPTWSYLDPKKMTNDAVINNAISPARQWIEARILQGAKTETIWKEYRLLCKVLPEEQWERLAKTWITARRCQILK